MKSHGIEPIGDLDGRQSITVMDEESVWVEYEQTGNAAEVGRRVGIPYHMAQAILNRDRIRKRAIQVSRSEDVAARWEGQEIKSANICSQILDMLQTVLSHIQQCIVQGRAMTDLKEIGPKGPIPLTPMEAIQWVLKYRNLDMVQKVGMTGAKICEGQRQVFKDDGLGITNQNGDPKTMSDAELLLLVETAEQSGQMIPWGIRQWKDHKLQQKSLPAVEICDPDN